MPEVFAGIILYKSNITLECGVCDLAQHEDGVGISLYNRKEEGTVEGQFQRDARLLYLFLRLGSFLGHLEGHFVDGLRGDRKIC